MGLPHLAALLLLCPMFACDQAKAPPTLETPALTSAEAPSWNELLARHVDADGWVDYKGLARERAALDAYVDALAKPGPDASAPAPERLAHLINAYNAFTLALILDAGIPASITDLHGGKPWDVVKWNLGGTLVSLNQIEHELIRPVFNEPRIHWALVCAAYSCPPLRNEAYDPARLEEQLAAQEAYVLNFNQPRYAQRDGGTVKVTALFDWYGDDFVSGNDGAQVYAASRLGVEAGSITGVLDYDWKLNDVSNR